MTKYEFKYLLKEISKIDKALEQDLCSRDHRKLLRKKSGLELLKNSEIAKGYGVIL